MEIGDMRNRITFFTVAPSINENGFETEQLIEFATVWAFVSNIHGNEYFAAKAVQAENTVKFIIRYLEGLDQNMKISFNNKKFNITTIDNIKYRNKYIEIKALEVDSNG